MIIATIRADSEPEEEKGQKGEDRHLEIRLKGELGVVVGTVVVVAELKLSEVRITLKRVSPQR